MDQTNSKKYWILHEATFVIVEEPCIVRSSFYEEETDAVLFNRSKILHWSLHPFFLLLYQQTKNLFMWRHKLLKVKFFVRKAWEPICTYKIIWPARTRNIIDRTKALLLHWVQNVYLINSLPLMKARASLWFQLPYILNLLIFFSRLKIETRPLKELKLIYVACRFKLKKKLLNK